MAIFRSSLLTLSVTLEKNTERNFYCEKSNYITNSYLGLCSEAAVQIHPFSKIYSENTCGRVLLLIKLQTVHSSDFILKLLYQECFLRSLPKVFRALK